MAIGQKFPPEFKISTDENTDAEVIRVTNGRYNSNHLYFTNNCIYDNESKMVICSDRTGTPNFFSVDLTNYEFTQLTDLPYLEFPGSYALFEGIVDGVRNKLYFFVKNNLHSVDLMDYSDKVIYTKPEGFSHHIVSCCNDSEFVYTSIYESFTYPKTADYATHPLSRIVRIKADGSGSDVIWEDKNWIAHVNVSPTDQTKITFCHEGRWNAVDHRIWGMDTNTCKVWKICNLEGWSVGHEFWYADGKHLGYHGYGKDGRVFGRVSFDDSDNRYLSFDYNTGHTFALDENLIVGDGDAAGKYLRLWKLENGEYAKPRALCFHGCSFKTQSAHVHPRFIDGGKSVLFTSDCGGYEQVYIVKVPEFESLPDLFDVSKC